MSIYMTRQEAEALKHGDETRPLLRDRFPVTKGAFAAEVTKEVAIAILCGEKQPEDAIAEWVAGKGGTAPVEMPEPGDHGKDQSPGDLTKDELDAIDKAVSVLKVVDPSKAQHVESVLAKASKKIEAAKFVSSGSEIVAVGGKVKIDGAEFPIITDENFTHKDLIPDASKHYNFKAWRASRKVGSKSYIFGAREVLAALVEDERIHLVGPAGTGKTSLIEQFAANTKWPVIRFQGRKDVTTDDFVGSTQAQGGQTYWQPGPLEIAMTIGAIFIADEFDHMPATCQSILHAVAEPGGKLVVTNDKGRIVHPHPNFRLILTSNTLGFGDEDGLHPGAAVQDYALISRLSATFHADYMTPSDERRLLVASTGVDAEIADKMVKVATDSRKAAENRQLTYPITLRQTQAWARWVARGFTVADAYMITCINKMPDNHVAPMMEIAQRNFGAPHF